MYIEPVPPAWAEPNPAVFAETATTEEERSRNKRNVEPLVRRMYRRNIVQLTRDKTIQRRELWPHGAQHGLFYRSPNELHSVFQSWNFKQSARARNSTVKAEYRLKYHRNGDGEITVSRENFNINFETFRSFRQEDV